MCHVHSNDYTLVGDKTSTQLHQRSAVHSHEPGLFISIIAHMHKHLLRSFCGHALEQRARYQGAAARANHFKRTLRCLSIRRYGAVHFFIRKRPPHRPLPWECPKSEGYVSLHIKNILFTLLIRLRSMIYPAGNCAACSNFFRHYKVADLKIDINQSI